MQMSTTILSIRFLFASLILVPVLAGCSCGSEEAAASLLDLPNIDNAPASTGPGPITASCNLQTLSSCEDMTANNPALALLGEQATREGCTTMSGTFANSACPTDGVIATCAISEGTKMIRYYSTGGAPYDLERARSECTAIAGVFSQ